MPADSSPDVTRLPLCRPALLTLLAARLALLTFLAFLTLFAARLLFFLFLFLFHDRVVLLLDLVDVCTYRKITLATPYSYYINRAIRKSGTDFVLTI